MGAGLSAIRTAAAGYSLEDLDLFTIVADDQMADEDGAVHAGTGAQALEAAELRLYGVVVVVILGGWVRVVRYSHGRQLPSRVGRVPGAGDSAGPSLCHELIVSSFVVKRNSNQV
jgi:hypothetical protein